ncbi:MAG: bifunctional 5,10-methylenetetrahydrofolate dehydrogenase/5,10-methenyltetrahydrofolate cyclohydrolase [Candidatus Microgenomates bacterium]
MKFDGKGFAKTIEEHVRERVAKLPTKPKIVSILVGNDPASVLYTGLKQKAAERVGVEFDVVKLNPKLQISNYKNLIAEIGQREDVTGIMIQLPVPGINGATQKDVISAIPYKKDVDGLRYPESGVVPPVVSAILRVMDNITLNHKLEVTNSKIVVVGAAGFVGSGVMTELAKRGIRAVGVERGDDMSIIKTGDIVISAVGEEDVIKPEMVREAVVVIDVGAPKGDMTKEVYQKASVSVEVPGGVGPVTIACLMENGAELYEMQWL